MARLRIAFFGLPLGALLLDQDGHDVCACVLSPASATVRLGMRRLRGRLGDGLVDPLVAGSDFDKRVDDALASTGPDLVVCWFYTRRIPERWLRVAPRGAIGVHPSILPRHRGPNPFFWAIDSGDRETGATVYRLGPEYDDGPVLAIRGGVLVDELDSWQLARKLDRITLELLRSVVRKVAGGESGAQHSQDERSATWAPEPTAELLRVDWSWPTERVLRRIRALSPVPGLALSVHNREFFVTSAERAAGLPSGLLPGEAALGEGRAVCVATGERAGAGSAESGIRIVRAVPAEDPGRTLRGLELADWLGL
jgi:methionyl-tRNA formyltransferase